MKAVVIPTSVYMAYFASQSSSQSVTKYRGITSSRNGLLSPFCEAACSSLRDYLGNCKGLTPSGRRDLSGGPKALVSNLPPKEAR